MARAARAASWRGAAAIFTRAHYLASMARASAISAFTARAWQAYGIHRLLLHRAIPLPLRDRAAYRARRETACAKQASDSAKMALPLTSAGAARCAQTARQASGGIIDHQAYQASLRAARRRRRACGIASPATVATLQHRALRVPAFARYAYMPAQRQASNVNRAVDAARRRNSISGIFGAAASSRCVKRAAPRRISCTRRARICATLCHRHQNAAARGAICASLRIATPHLPALRGIARVADRVVAGIAWWYAARRHAR